jgi:hypothetical protein
MIICTTELKLQVRDATSKMESAIWQFRCRAGIYAQGSEGPAASTQALSAAVRKCREAIMVSADVRVGVVKSAGW